jgi:biopolymer transport protein ExbD
MVATVMRENTLKIQNNLPFADQVEKLDKKDLIMYIYAGKPSTNYKQYGTEAKIQLNDDFAEVKDIVSFIASERASKREELIPFLTTALKVDSDANMGLIGDIKQELRKVNALKINYTTKKGSVFGN